MSDTISATTVTDADGIARAWLDDFQRALDSKDAVALGALFTPDAYLSDLLVFDWDLHNHFTPAGIGGALAASSHTVSGLAVRTGDEPAVTEMGETLLVTSFIRFDTPVATGDGFLRLRQDLDGAWKAQNLVVELIELNDHAEQVGIRRPIGRRHGPEKGRKGWSEQRDTEFVETEPTAVIVGGGHNGLAVAARLVRLGVSTLVLERNPRIGDNWRNRYPSLALHDPVAVDHLPYLPLPESWPYYTPKDKFADYLEAYATLMDVPTWTGVSTSHIAFDEKTERWSIDVERADGSIRTLHPRHLVLATGPFSLARAPEIDGSEVFQGALVHSTGFTGGRDWAGKKAVVVGTGVSGHDVAQELFEQGADVTLLQRGPTYVVNAATFHKFMFTEILQGHPTEDADLMSASRPFIQVSNGQGIFEMMAEQDPELHAALEQKGFLVGAGQPDAFTYYYNVGASELIIDGSVALKVATIDHLTATGVVLDDGTELPADLVVLATGFGTVKEQSRGLLGDDIVDALPDIGGIGPDLKFIGTFGPSGKDRLWFAIARGVFVGRFASKFLALQIKGIEEGIIPARRA
jgi:putative flavoprotein involved in K+ transport